ncbi:MAG: serine/threonine protein kinase [Polyangiaceae bacterium]|jgi:serine/threonine-protein kinase|nr:serine/threonine protein kinase [Polyangiaceae bacterium]
MANRGARAPTDNLHQVELTPRSLLAKGQEEQRSAKMPIADTLSPDESAKISTYKVVDNTRLGPYQIVCELASGGMASVHLALYRSVEGFEKLCAVKRIHPHLANERSFTDMFADEARIAACISHPFVCSVFSFGRSQQSHYIAMEFLRGEPLSAITRRLARSPDLGDDPRFPALAARLLANFAEGLFAAHTLRDDRGKPLEIVHRDVTPQNLFVLYDGTVRVTDFGIAHARRRLHHTQGQKLKGKLSYVAPEQLSEGPVDQRVDIWGLGVTLWELLAGRRLFLGSSEGETLASVMSRVVQPPSAFRATVPPELDRIVLRALERDVNKRYRTARDFARDLERFLNAIGDQFPAMDVADWMSSVFPQGMERLQALGELAAQVSAATADETVVRIPSVPPAAGPVPASYVFMAARDVSPRPTSSMPPTAEYPLGVSAAQIDASLGAILAKPRDDRAPAASGTIPLATDEPVAARPAAPSKPHLELVEEQTSTRSLLLDGNHGRILAVIGSALLLASGVASVVLRDRGDEISPPQTAITTPKLAPVLAETAPSHSLATPDAPVTIDAIPIDALATERPSTQKKPGRAPAVTAVASAAVSATPATGVSFRPVGDLFITGGAGDVLENGQIIGHAPGRFRLSVGQHSLTLRGVNGDVQSMQVEIRAGAPTLVTVRATH